MNPLRKFDNLASELDTSKGKWELDSGHKVLYREKGRGLGKEVRLRGSLVAAEPEALVISLTLREDEKREVTGIVKLAGRWELDAKNRITFSVKRALGREDKLTFQGAWEVDENHEVVYTYETRKIFEGRGRKRRALTHDSQELVFKGTWDISEKNQLTYLLGANSDSAFRIRGAFQTQSIRAKEGEIRYQFGIEFQTRRGARKHVTQTLILFGKWKISGDLELSFELESQNSRKQVLRFGAVWKTDALIQKLQTPKGAAGQVLTKVMPSEVALNLTAPSGKPLGLELILTKEFLEGNAEAFLHLVRAPEESLAEAGVRLRW